MLGLFCMEIRPPYGGTDVLDKTADMEIEIGTEYVLQLLGVCVGQMRPTSVILPEGNPEIGE